VRAAPGVIAETEIQPAVFEARIRVPCSYWISFVVHFAAVGYSRVLQNVTGFRHPPHALLTFFDRTGITVTGLFMRLLPPCHHPGAMAFVTAPLRPALSDALILLTGNDGDQEQAGEEKTPQSTSRFGAGSNHNIGLSKVNVANWGRSYDIVRTMPFLTVMATHQRA
jgi:hypothetical protein